MDEQLTFKVVLERSNEIRRFQICSILSYLVNAITNQISLFTHEVCYFFAWCYMTMRLLII